MFDLTCYAAVTLANLSVKLESGEVKKIRVTCGRGYETLLARFDPDTQSWRMCEGTSRSGALASLESLPPSGTTRSGELYPRPPWEPLTDVIGSSLWPTPTTVYREHPNAEWVVEGRNLRRVVKNGGRTYSMGLANAARMWPTPTAVTRPMEGNVRLYRAKVEAGEMTEAEAEAILGKSVWEAQGKLPANWPTLVEVPTTG